MKKIILHGLFWLCILLFFTFFFGLEDASFKTVITFSAFLLPVTMATTYTFVYSLVPHYLLQNKPFAFAGYALATLIISSNFIIYSTFYGLVLSEQLTLGKEFPIKKSLLFINVAVYLVVILGCTFSLLKQNYKTNTANEILKNKVLEGQLQLKQQELQYLKMQIHPHFLFNTLNTLYGFALKKSDETPELILKFSNLLDYILYQTQKSKVPLIQEVEHIQDYISLEKMRFENNLTILFKCDPIPEELEIAPMILLPFIENSFKHGRLPDGSIKVDLELKIDQKQLIFRLKNTKMTTIESNSSDFKCPPQSGIGLENLKKRLSIIYASHYDLIIKNSIDFYEVKLTLPIHHVN
ncbi:MAG: sensor histidine kinase [Leeuwenhoekiella sp.]